MNIYIYYRNILFPMIYIVSIWAKLLSSSSQGQAITYYTHKSASLGALGLNSELEEEFQLIIAHFRENKQSGNFSSSFLEICAALACSSGHQQPDLICCCCCVNVYVFQRPHVPLHHRTNCTKEYIEGLRRRGLGGERNLEKLHLKQVCNILQ